MANKEEIKNPAAEEISVDEIPETEETVTEEVKEEPTELEKLQDDYAALNDKYLRIKRCGKDRPGNQSCN